MVRGWLEREEGVGLVPGQVCSSIWPFPSPTKTSAQVWYLIPMAWWTSWHSFVNWSDTPSSLTNGTLANGSLARRKKAVQSSLASDSSPRVVATGQCPASDLTRGGYLYFYLQS